MFELRTAPASAGLQHAFPGPYLHRLTASALNFIHFLKN